MEEERHRAISQAANCGEAVRRLDAICYRIGRLEGPSIVEDLRRDRSRDER